MPVIRFAGFTDTWEQRKLCNVATIITGTTPSTADGTNYDGNRLFVSPADIQGNRFVDNTITTLSDKGFNTGRVLPPTTSLFVSIGSTIGKVAQLSDYATTNQQINAVVPCNEYDADFMFSLLENIAPTVRKSSATQAVPIINKTAFGEIEIPFTSKQEQETIGRFFLDLDTLITLHQYKYEKLISVRKAMLGKLFPKEGSVEPEVRFAGFTDSWKQRKLGEIFEEYSEKGHAELPPLTIIQGGGTIRRDESDRNLQYDTASLSSYKLVNEGDFIVHLRSFEGGLERATTTGIISPAYHTFHGEGTDSRFYYQYFRSSKFINVDLKPHVYGIRDGRSIDIDGMKTIEIPWTSLEEQRAIGNYIETIDTLITLHQRKLEKLKNIKKALLDKMFV